jgi:hypothetical protein
MPSSGYAELRPSQLETEQMPGHMLKAFCLCGFVRNMLVGSSIDDLSSGVGATCICYTADGKDLITASEKDIQEQGLEKIDDPFLSYDPLSPHQGDYDGYRCPVCGQNTMSLAQGGNWD